MGDRGDSWRVLIRDLSVMGRLRAVMVLGRTELTLVEAIEVVNGDVRSFASGPLTRRQAERVARSAVRHGADASVEPWAPV